MSKKYSTENERCAICGCAINRSGHYAQPSIAGRSHATEHHFVAERFFGRSAIRRGEKRIGIFQKCPWMLESKAGLFCYECHEELLHNPVFLPQDIQDFSELARLRNLDEDHKTESREKLAGRIQLLHEVIQTGIKVLLAEKLAQT